MKYIKEYKLFEKSTLINIGVPYVVMQQIQKDFAISDDAQWNKIGLKKEIVAALKKEKNTLIITICKNSIQLTFSYNTEYYLETYKCDDFGNWQRKNRIQGTIDEIAPILVRGCKSYELISGNWSHEFSVIRKSRKADNEFQEITDNFKTEFAENFTRIVKKLYGKKANIITDIIINHLKRVNKNISDEKIREILFLNVDRAKEIDIYKKKQGAKDPYKLYNDVIKANSLTIFDTQIISFEDSYSDKYKEFLNIPIMIEKFSLEKIITSFMVYLYCNKLIDL